MSTIGDPPPAAILLVDDHEANLLALEVALDPLGYTLVRALSGAEALALSAAREFALAVVDAHMPGMDGYETVERMRSGPSTREIPVVFLTAVHDDPEHVRRGYALGAIDFIAKPIDTTTLRAKVKSIVLLYEHGRRHEQRRSAEIDRMRDLFLGGVGHDLRNPLNTIMMASRLVANKSCSQSSHATHALRIERAAARMNGMIDDILDLTRAQLAGGIPLAREPVDLGDLARSVVAELVVAHPTRTITIDVAGDVGGEWDRSRVARVVSNLVGNAIQHALGAVHVGVEEAGDDVLLLVHNNGASIAAHDLARIFQSFQRGGTSGAKGLGLGLHVVSEIARAHGGGVDVASSTDSGTTFTVKLPRRVVARGG